MKTLLATAALCAVLQLAATPTLAAQALPKTALPSTPGSAKTALPSTNTAWLPAAADADIDRAFAQAKRENKPVLLYWGATWCPPCNQLKATFFNRQEFAALAKSFVAVHVDGDRPGAQKIGQRFAVSGYPSVVLMNAAGKELTRLPGEVDAEQLLAVLKLGLAGGRPAQAVLADALAGKPLGGAEWRLLAFYSYATDEQRLVPKADVAQTLARLAAASAAATPPAEPDLTTRLWLTALAESDEGKGVKPDPALRERVQRVLADPAAARLHMDVLTNGAKAIVRTLDEELSPGRSAMATAFDTALQRLQADTTLSRSDRMGALYARVQLARIEEPKDAVSPPMPEALVKDLRDISARFDREVTDGYERQAVITHAAGTLAQAGLWTDSDALLKANLAKSHSPYYLMSQLGGNARKQGKKDEALNWYAQAFDTSVGPATRLQWGTSYLGALIDLAPQDSSRIEKTAATLLAEAAKDKAAFEARSARAMQRIGSRLVAWNGDGKHSAEMKRLQAQLDGVCAKVAAPQRAACQGLLKKPAAAKA
jgi:thiol-disulfide isomerase/thioredoxin